jgi:hypothetical protein
MWHFSGEVLCGLEEEVEGDKWVVLMWSRRSFNLSFSMLLIVKPLTNKLNQGVEGGLTLLASEISWKW